MKIYAVKPDTRYRFMYPEDDVYKSENWEFKCQPLIEKLPKLFKACFSKKSGKPNPDIAYIGMLTFAFRQDVATELADMLEEVGELLPFYVENELWYCLNVLENADAIDEENSVYEYDDGIIKTGGFKKLAFITDKIPETTSLFKVPSDNYTIIYCADRRDNDEQILNNFFCAIAAHEYTGIKFEAVYDEK